MVEDSKSMCANPNNFEQLGIFPGLPGRCRLLIIKKKIFKLLHIYAEICMAGRLRILAIHGAKTTKNHTPWYILLDYFTTFQKSV